MELRMPEKGAENMIYDVVAKGDAIAFQQLLHQDPLLLDRVSHTCSNKTPLHMATLQGKSDIVEEILNRNPQLAEELDSQNSSALHMASAKGYVKIANKLLSAAPDMCLSRDCQGRNPLHLAAVKGRVPILEELVQVNPAAANAKLDRGRTVLHLCIEHNQLEPLKFLVPKLSELVYAKDDDGETMLHLAVRYKRVEIVRYLVEELHMDKYAKNCKGQTPLKILKQQSPSSSDDTTSEIIRNILLRARFNNTQSDQLVEWLTEKRDSIMVVAILIATMAFQAAVSPAGGVWEEDSPQLSKGNSTQVSEGNSTQVSDLHKAGEAVMAYKHPNYYKNFIRCNTTAFVLSLSTILLLISGLPFKYRPFMWALMVIMWSSVTCIAVTYGVSVSAVTPEKHSESLSDVVETGIIVWCGVMGVLLVGNSLRLINRGLKSKGVNLWQPPGTIFRKRVEGKHEDNVNQEGLKSERGILRRPATFRKRGESIHEVNVNHEEV